MNSPKVNNKLSLHISQIAAAGGIGWLLGMVLSSFSEEIDWFLILVLISACFLWLILLKNNKLILVWIILLAAFLGAWRYQYYILRADLGMADYNDTRQEFIGIIIDEPDVRINHTKLIIAVKQLKKDGKMISNHGLVLLSVGLYPSYQYGDELLIDCHLQKPQPIDDFAYDRYLAKSGIYSVCSFAKIKIVSRGNGDWLKGKLLSTKKAFQQTINQHLPEPEASVASAVILGSKKTIPKELTDVFSKTGTSHIIAISGMHIAIMIGIISYWLIFLGVRRQYLFLIMGPILVFYVALIGFPPSAVRATVMGYLLLLAISVGRLSSAFNMVLLAAVVMTAHNPLIISNDIGFQLSFSAVLGIMFLSEFFELVGKMIIPGKIIIKVFATSAAASIATAPLVVWHFGRFSLIGLLVNTIVIPVLPLMIFAIFGGMLLALVFPPPVGDLAFWPAYFVLRAVLEVISLSSKIPFAFVDL